MFGCNPIHDSITSIRIRRQGHVLTTTVTEGEYTDEFKGKVQQHQKENSTLVAD